MIGRLRTKNKQPMITEPIEEPPDLGSPSKDKLNCTWQLVVPAHVGLGTARVVGAAIGTLVTQNVELDQRSLLAVVTYDANSHVSVFSWHWGLCNLPIHFSPNIIIPIQRDITNGATQGLKPCTRHLKLAQTVLMYSVPTLQDGDRHS